MIRKVLSLYRFTQSEKRSLVLLLSILIFLNLFALILKRDSEDHSTLVEVESQAIPANLSSQQYSGQAIKKNDKSNRIPVQKEKLDINEADSTSFLTLYGIGPVFAGRIVKYRKLLGGFYDCKQLLEVYGMDSLRYQGFISDIECKSIVLKNININTVGFKELLRHPYLDYENVKLIVNYRDKNGPIDMPEVLWRNSVLSDSLKVKLLPYLKAAE